MRTYDFVHLALLALGKEICGKTKLQKTIYFLGLLDGCAEELGYRSHYYGPYSDSVADAVNRLKSVGFVDQSSTHFGVVNAAGFEMARHDFRLTPDGRHIAEKKAAENPDRWRRIQEAAAKLGAAGDLDYMKMSVAAKTFFILKQKGGQANPEQISEAAKGLGWNPSPSEVNDSAGYLQRLGLVSAS